MNHFFETTTAEEKFFDYCHYQYMPTTTHQNKHRSINLLYHFLQQLNFDAPFFEIISIIREKVGPKNTVWGIKKINDSYACEFYFYSSGRSKDNRLIAASQLLECLKPLYRCHINVDESLNYFMFSIDVFPGFHQKEIKGIHAYIGPFAYFLDADRMTLENHYAFYDPRKKIEPIANDVYKSAFVDFNRLDSRQVLMPQLFDCKSICRAHKNTHDGIYYSGLDVGQFLFFLKTFAYPQSIISFIEENRARLDHLQYDVGFDYTMKNNKI
ncbi:MAG: hypothetical protein GY765_20505, partial [bacterium]|nr:hypothetical protein [bacterium]